MKYYKGSNYGTNILLEAGVSLEWLVTGKDEFLVSPPKAKEKIFSNVSIDFDGRF